MLCAGHSQAGELSLIIVRDFVNRISLTHAHARTRTAKTQQPKHTSSQDPWPQFCNGPAYSKMMKFLCMMTKPVDEDDFALFRVLGRGGFGLVNGCKKCTSGKLYAMKVMNKKR